MADNKISDATKDLITYRYDEADNALDALSFLMVAGSSMQTTYSDTVASGFMEIMTRSIDVLRSYTSEARERLLELEREAQRQGVNA